MTRDPWIGRMKDDDVTGIEPPEVLRGSSPYLTPPPEPTNPDHVKDFTSMSGGEIIAYLAREAEAGWKHRCPCRECSPPPCPGILDGIITGWPEDYR